MEEFYEWLQEFVIEVLDNGDSVYDDDTVDYDKGYIRGYRDCLGHIVEVVEEDFLGE